MTDHVYNVLFICTGNSARSATSVHTQGVAVIAPNSQTFSGNGAL